MNIIAKLSLSILFLSLLGLISVAIILTYDLMTGLKLKIDMTKVPPAITICLIIILISLMIFNIANGGFDIII